MNIEVKADFKDLGNQGVWCNVVVTVNGVSNVGDKRIEYRAPDDDMTDMPTIEEAASQALTWAVAHAIGHARVPRSEIK